VRQSCEDLEAALGASPRSEPRPPAARQDGLRRSARALLPLSGSTESCLSWASCYRVDPPYTYTSRPASGAFRPRTSSRHDRRQAGFEGPCATGSLPVGIVALHTAVAFVSALAEIPRRARARSVSRGDRAADWTRRIGWATAAWCAGGEVRRGMAIAAGGKRLRPLLVYLSSPVGAESSARGRLSRSSSCTWRRSCTTT